MIKPSEFFNLLKCSGFEFFTGIPDSFLIDFCAYIDDNTDDSHHVIAANEGASIALAAGYYLATGKPSVVYLQNSGIGNAINPLLSLADKDVFSIPIMLIIGWRGQPGLKDEPQHKKQGKILIDLMNSLGYKNVVLNKNITIAHKQINDLVEAMYNELLPVALIVEKNTFEPYEANKKVEKKDFQLTREDTINHILEHLDSNDILVSTTGKTSREIYELRELKKQSHYRDFLAVGSMGHSLMIALGISKNTNKNVFIIDGDGAALMHLGSMAIAGYSNQKNLKHIIINNGAHDSVGGQPTVASLMHFHKLGLTLGYRKTFFAQTSDEIKYSLTQLINEDGPALLEVRVKTGARENLGRPKQSPKENKIVFMRNFTK